MEYFISDFELARIVELAAELGAMEALMEVGIIKPYLKKSEAIKKFGRKNIAKWLEMNLILPVKDGNHSATYRLNRMEIETIKKCTQIVKVETVLK